MNKKILKKFITITSLVLAFVFITIDIKAEVTDAERSRLQDIERRIEQYAQNLKPNYQNPKRTYQLFLSKDDIFFVFGIFNCERTGQSMLTEFTIPNKGAVCASDWHGDLVGLTETAAAARKQEKAYIITGDLVDRGRESVECAIYALIQEILHPDRFFYLAGDHEFENTNRNYGLWAEINAKYGADADEIFNAFNHSFGYLSLAALANGKAFFVHAGFGQTTDLGKLKALSAPRSSWEHKEISLEDEERLNPQDRETLQALNEEYKRRKRLNLTTARYNSEEDAILAFLNGIINPEKMVLDIVWANFYDSRYGYFAVCTDRGFSEYAPFYKTATNFTALAVRSFFNKNGLTYMVRGHEHNCSNCGGRQKDVEGNKVVTTTSSKNIYLFEKGHNVLPKGDVVHIAEDLSVSFQDTEAYVAKAKLEEQRKQGQENCDALLQQMNELFKFKENYESEKRLAREQEETSNQLEALDHQIKAQIVAMQAVTFEYTALADKYGYLNNGKSDEFRQKARMAKECEKKFTDVEGSIQPLMQARNKLRSTPKRRFIKRAFLSRKIKQRKRKIEDKVNSVKDLVTPENKVQLCSEGMEDYDMVESNNDIQRMLAGLKN
ncbi:MAG: metallophosphoesterase [Lactobacillales bacterium]|jgi:uncharacterized protein YqgV (UPF0045/DUF77 family)|nr:metallophosphoesterase [Lactobacillales bacterium]